MLYIKGRQLLALIFALIAAIIMVTTKSTIDKILTVYVIDSTEIDSKYAESSIVLGDNCVEVKNKSEASIIAEFTTSLSDNATIQGKKFCVGYSDFSLNFDDSDVLGLLKDRFTTENKGNYEYLFSMREFISALADSDISWLEYKDGKVVEIYIPNKGSLENEIITLSMRNMIAESLGQNNIYSQSVTDKLNVILSRCRYFGNYDTLKELVEQDYTMAILPKYVVESEHIFYNNYTIRDNTNYNLMLYATLQSNTLDVSDKDVYSLVLSGFSSSGFSMYDKFFTIDPSYWENYSNVNSINRLERVDNIS